MHALSPAPDIQFEPVINFRYIPNGETRFEVVEIKNEGRIQGYFTFEEVGRTKPFLLIEPSSFQIQPDETVHCRIGLTGTLSELINKKIKVTVQGREDKPKFIEITATCVDQTLSIVFEEGGGVKSSLNFGTLYMGERKEYPAFLVNNGPQPAHFKFKFL